MPTNKTHEELIRGSDFNDKFKNNVRDYFIYQFKTSSTTGSSDFKALRKKGGKIVDYNVNKHANTIADERNRIANVLDGVVAVRKDKKGAPTYITVDSRELATNPFHLFYRFCLSSPNDAANFFLTLFSLHREVTYDAYSDLKRVEEILAPDQQEWENYGRSHRQEVYRYFSSNEILSEDLQLTLGLHGYLSPDTLQIIDKPRLTTTQLLRLAEENNLFTTALDNRLDELEQYGILNDFRSNAKGIHKWSLEELTLSELIKKADAKRFAAMVSFFAGTYPFGEIGEFLKSRMGESESPFRFKHYYMIQAMNDYNLADLLDAMERGSEESRIWIKVRYRNAVNLEYQEMVCLPLEIRISTYNGREYLAYYHPEKRSVSTLRIDFIDEVVCGRLTELAEYGLSEEELRSDLENAEKLLSYVWGTSFLGFKEGNAKQPPSPKRVRVVLQGNRREEPYIFNRLQRERRHGKVSENEQENSFVFEIETTDPFELIPWIRSFCVRIRSFTVDGKEQKQLIEELNYFFRNYQKGAIAIEERKTNLPPHRKEKFLPDDGREDFFLPDERVPAHALVFNEIFSFYYELIGNCVLSCSKLWKDRKGSLSELYDVLDTLLADSSEKKKEIEMDSVMEDCVQQFRRTKGELTPKYLFPKKANYLQNLLPLTISEKRWLASVLKDTKAKLFLEQGEIDELLGLLGESPLFSAEKLVYYDQFDDVTPVYKEESYREYFRNILEAALLHQKISIVYHTAKDTDLTGVYAPVRLEYSKREDRFRVYAVSDGGGVFSLNLERLESVEVQQEAFSMAEASELLQKEFAESKRTVELQFKKLKNVPDRILSEFAPWEKICTLDRKTGIYTLSVTYDKSDEYEIIIRILSYGPYVIVTEGSESMKRELFYRLEKQNELFRERTEDRER